MPMNFGGVPVLDTFSITSIASGTTAAAVIIPPYSGPRGGAPYLYNAQASYVPTLTAAPLAGVKPNWLLAPNFGVIHITSIQCNASSTQHSLFIQRPLNWTYFPGGLAKNTTVIPNAAATGINEDPGVYSTNYRYPTAGANFPAQVGDAAISSTNLYVCYQLSDGSWQVDTVASGTFGATLTLTTGTPNRTGGAIANNAPLFYFGAIPGTLLDPATGLVAWGTKTLVSVQNLWQDNLNGEYVALHQGDPLFIYDANATAADSIVVSGYYGAW